MNTHNYNIDTLKYYIEFATLLDYGNNKSFNMNNLLLKYINVKNIEVPGRNMKNFHQVYTKYNSVIDDFKQMLNIDF